MDIDKLILRIEHDAKGRVLVLGWILINSYAAKLGRRLQIGFSSLMDIDKLIPMNVIALTPTGFSSLMDIDKLIHC